MGKSVIGRNNSKAVIVDAVVMVDLLFVIDTKRTDLDVKSRLFSMGLFLRGVFVSS